MNKRRIIIILFIVLIIAFSLFLTVWEKKLNDARREIDSLKSDLADTEIEISKKDDELKSNKTLINNSNKLLSTVYYGTAKPVEGGETENFTAFSLFYRDRLYLITAGHCIEYEGIKYSNFKFKQNNSELFIYPNLLDYNNDYISNNDYAIFSSHSVRKGLRVHNEYDKDSDPKYVLGNTERGINFFKEFNNAAAGESGSPILNSSCRVVGVVIKSNDQYTPIEVVTEAIDRLIEVDGESE